MITLKYKKEDLPQDIIDAIYTEFPHPEDSGSLEDDIEHAKRMIYANGMMAERQKKPRRLIGIIVSDNRNTHYSVEVMLEYDNGDIERKKGHYYSLANNRLTLYDSMGGSGYGYSPAETTFSIPFGEAVVENTAGNDKWQDRFPNKK